MSIIAENSQSSNIPAGAAPIATEELGGSLGSGAVSFVIDANPVSNTGLDCNHPSLTVKIDWLTFTLPACPNELQFSIIKELRTLTDEWFTTIEGRFGLPGCHYTRKASAPSGCEFTWLPPCDECPTGRARISICATALGRVYLPGLWAFANYLFTLQANCTRFDVALDDFTKSVEPQQILDAESAGNLFGVRNGIRVYGTQKGGAIRGFTLNLGSRSSDKMSRYYDKDFESKGAIPAYRWETEFKGKYSAEYASILFSIDVSDSVSIAKFLSNIAVGTVDFKDSSVSDRRSIAPRLSWWQEFIDRCGGILRMSFPAPKPTIERKMKWLERQKSSIALVVDAIRAGAGQESNSWRRYLENLIDDGRRAYKDIHFGILQTVYMELDNPLFQLGDSVPISDLLPIA